MSLHSVLANDVQAPKMVLLITAPSVPGKAGNSRGPRPRIQQQDRDREPALRSVTKSLNSPAGFLFDLISVLV